MGSCEQNQANQTNLEVKYQIILHTFGVEIVFLVGIIQNGAQFPNWPAYFFSLNIVHLG